MTIHIRLGLAFPLCASATTRLASQARQDSLEERLEKAEEAIQRLQRQLDEQAQSWVAAAQDTTGLANSSIGGVLRQTRIGITVRPGQVLGADLSGELQMDFYGAEALAGLGDGGYGMDDPDDLRRGNSVGKPHQRVCGIGVLMRRRDA